MHIEREIEDLTLNVEPVDDDDEPDDVAVVMCSIVTRDGMRYAGSTGIENLNGDEARPDQIADALIACTVSAARLHSPEAARIVVAQLRGEQ